MERFIGAPPFQWQGEINRKSEQWLGLVGWWTIPTAAPGLGVLDAARGAIVPFPAASANQPAFAIQPFAEQIGRTLSFSATAYTDANRDYIPIPTLSLGTEQTLAYWCAYNNYTSLSYGGVVFGYDNNYYFDWISGSTRYAVFGSGNAASVTSGISKGTMSHLAITRNGTSVQFYLNGRPDGAPQTLGANNALLLSFIGHATTVANGYYGLKGTLGDTRIYNRALKAAEIWQLYDPQTRWELYQPPHPMVWWIPPVTSSIIPQVRHHMAQQGMA